MSELTSKLLAQKQFDDCEGGCEDELVVTSNVGTLDEWGLTIGHFSNKRYDKLMNEVAKKGYIDLMIYLFENGCDTSNYQWELAAVFGHLDIIKYAHENKLKYCNRYDYKKKIKYNNVLSWELINNACFGGQTECLKYLCENNYFNNMPTAFTVQLCIRGNQLDCLKILIQHGYKWIDNKYDDKETNMAAELGNLEILKYCHQNGSIINMTTKKQTWLQN